MLNDAVPSRTGDRAGVEDHIWILCCPLVGLAGPHRPPGDEAQPLDAQRLSDELMLQANVVVDGDPREAGPFERRGRVAWRGRHAVAEQVRQDDEILAGIQRSVCSDHERFSVSVGPGVPAWNKDGV